MNWAVLIELYEKKKETENRNLKKIEFQVLWEDRKFHKITWEVTGKNDIIELKKTERKFQLGSY